MFRPISAEDSSVEAGDRDAKQIVTSEYREIHRLRDYLAIPQHLLGVCGRRIRSKYAAQVRVLPSLSDQGLPEIDFNGTRLPARQGSGASRHQRSEHFG